MARRPVLEITCDRCHKTETQDVDSAPEEGIELEVKFQGQTVSYADLCRRCRGAVENYYKSMTKQNDDDDAKSGDSPKETSPEAPGKTKGFLSLGQKKIG